MREKKILKVLTAMLTITAVTGGALYYMPDSVFEQVSITAEASTASGTLSSGVKWELADGTLTLSGSGEVTTPNYWLKYSSEIKKVVIGDGVTSISSSIFMHSSSLESVTISSSVKYIGNYAFYNCKMLKSVTFEKSKTSDNELEIGPRAFCNCTRLTDITFSDNLISLETGAFSGCESLENIKLPDSLTFIGDNAFRGTALTKIEIPDGVDDIGEFAFINCQHLESVKLPSSITTIRGYTFNKCTSLKSVVIPEGVKTIKNYAFADCSGLERVSFPSSLPVSGIESAAFMSVGDIAHIHIPENASYEDYAANKYLPAAELNYISGGCNFTNCSLNDGSTKDLLTWTLENGTLTVTGKGALGTGNVNPIEWLDRKAEIKNVVVGDGVTSVGTFAFGLCPDFESLTISSSVALLDYGAFYNHPKLETVKFVKSRTSNNKTVIGESAFNTCPSLKSVTFTDNITSIEDMAFNDCTSLNNVVIPEGVTKLGKFAFSGCTSLERISFPKSLTDIDSNAFFSTNNIKHIHIPEGTAYTDYATGNNYLPTDESYYFIGECDDEDCPMNVKGTGVEGDVNQDGIFDIDDVIDLARSILTTAPGSENPYMPYGGDRDGSGNIDIDDVILLARQLIM